MQSNRESSCKNKRNLINSSWRVRYRDHISEHTQEMPRSWTQTSRGIINRWVEAQMMTKQTFFSSKKYWCFSYFFIHENINYEYSLESPRRGASNQYQLHITKTCLFKYTENFTTKNGNFLIKKLWYFPYFCSKHRLWVLVRTASARRF